MGFAVADAPVLFGSDTWVEAPPSAVLGAVRVAAGAAADVYRGTLDPATAAATAAASDENVAVVALRRPRITSAEALARFEREVALRGRLRHPHILPLLAACTAPPHYCTISPWMHGGDLFDALHVRGTRFDFPRTLALAIQIADALQYLHTHRDLRVVHRDVKSANILLDRALASAQLADFDLAVSVNNRNSNKLAEQAAGQYGRAMHRGPSNGRLAHMVGTLVYMAPEVLQGEPHGLPADVYAFAVTCNEVAAAAVPYVDCELPVPELHTVLETRFNEVSLRRAIVKDNLRPAMADRVPRQFSTIIADAWHPDPQRRPSIDIVLQKLKAIASMGTPYLSQFTAAIGGDIAFDDRQTIDSSTPLHQPAWSTGKDVNTNLLKELQVLSIGPPLPVWYKQCSALEKTTAGALPSSMTKKMSQVDPRVLAAISSTPGGRGADRMEDRSFVHSDVLGMVGTHLMAVFDGHGGSSCSQFALEVLPSALYRAWTRPEATPVSALVRAFQDTDTAFLTVSPPAEQSGCTALATLVIDSMLYVANVGDCRCVLGLRDGTSQVLTKDHVALEADERARIEARGGTVDPISGRLEGRLIVSRAFGDRRLKRYISATPEVTTVPLSPAHDFFIVASDGLWDVVSSADASALVRSTARSPDLAAKRLALKAIELGSDDNISVIVALLDWDTGTSVRQAM